MKKLLYVSLLFFPILVKAQGGPPIDTARYLSKPVPAVMRTDTSATNLVTYNQVTHQANLMSGATLTAYFRNGLAVSKKIPTNGTSKSANYTITTTDFIVGNVARLTVFCDDSGGSFTVTLPTAIAGYPIDIVKTNTSTNAITISGATGTFNVISGLNQSKSYISNGTTWVNN